MRTQSSGGHDARRFVRMGIVALLAVIVVVGRGWKGEGGDATAVDVPGNLEALELFQSRRSGVVVVVEGAVEALLSDDDRGSRHQRFIVRIAPDHTLLIAHNIDLASRVPLTTGDAVRVRGEYEWNAQGGVLHWTHHDPDGDREGGWIEFRGERYR